MRTLWYVIYNFAGIPVLWIFFRMYSLFNSKVREGFKGRRELFGNLDNSLLNFKKGSTVLIHSSSLGEYQQAIPLADEFIKKKYSVVISFFSPSGFNNSRIEGKNIVKTYIPFDSVKNEKLFLEKINPEIIVFMRYDLWYNLLYTAKKKGIRTILANARYDENDSTWDIPVVSSFKKTLYGMIDAAFVIDDSDEINYSKKLKNENTKIIRTGDSKFERVLQSVQGRVSKAILPEKVTPEKKIFVMGSSWKDDEDILLPAINKAVKYDDRFITVLVPHEPKETKISAIEKTIESKYTNLKSIRYSSIKNYSNENLIIIDRIGLLSGLYSSAYISYVGGGFKTGLHNILEPAIFNMPILFSNKVKNSDEDEILLKYGCGIIIESTNQFYRIFRSLLKNEDLRNETGSKCRLVFKGSTGIAEKIVSHTVGNI